jgi:hypothetical protein
MRARSIAVLFTGCAIVMVASGELGRTRAQAPASGQPQQVQAVEQPSTPGTEASGVRAIEAEAVSRFVKDQSEVVRQNYAGRVLGHGTAMLINGGEKAGSTAHSWLAWSDGKKLFIDVQGILSMHQVGVVKWKRFDLANEVTRFTVDADDPEAAWFYLDRNYDVHMTDLPRLFSSGFKNLQEEDMPPK